MATAIDAGFVQRDPDILGGIPVFAGTRVPVQTLLDYFADGQSLDEFIDDFPSVRKEQACDVLETLKQLLQDDLHETAA